MNVAVFVPDAHASACVAVIRSLGRAGYNVHTGSPDPNAIGLRSRFANHSVICPAFNDPLFVDWMRAYVIRHDIKMIVPTNGVLVALMPAFKEFKHLLPVSPDENTLVDCFSKIKVVDRFIKADPLLGLMNNHPQSTLVDLSKPLDTNVLPRSQYGYYIKCESPRCLNLDSTSSFAYEENGVKALASLVLMSSNWKFALVQEAVSGFQVGVSVLMDNGKALAVSCVRDCHPYPHSRGTMSLRESCWFADIADDTIKRLSFLNWQGCAMGEYRLDVQTQTFNLIEINFRYWQYLHLDLWAGMDYPLMQAQWFLDGKSQFQNKPKLGVICRDTWPGEVAQQVNEWRRSDLKFHLKIRGLLMFFVRSCNPQIHSDFNFPGDRTLYIYRFINYLKSDIKSVSKKLSRYFKLLF